MNGDDQRGRETADRYGQRQTLGADEEDHEHRRRQVVQERPAARAHLNAGAKEDRIDERNEGERRGQGPKAVEQRKTGGHQREPGVGEAPSEHPGGRIGEAQNGEHRHRHRRDPGPDV
jgi:hypothetical protein